MLGQRRQRLRRCEARHQTVLGPRVERCERRARPVRVDGGDPLPQTRVDLAAAGAALHCVLTGLRAGPPGRLGGPPMTSRSTVAGSRAGASTTSTTCAGRRADSSSRMASATARVLPKLDSTTMGAVMASSPYRCCDTLHLLFRVCLAVRLAPPTLVPRRASGVTNVPRCRRARRRDVRPGPTTWARGLLESAPCDVLLVRGAVHSGAPVANADGTAETPAPTGGTPS